MRHEIDREGNPVWEWEAALSEEMYRYPLNPICARVEFSHANSVWPLDNGADVLYGGPGAGSRVVELDPATGEIVWQYQGSPPGTFFSWFISGAQRLESGNTLICEGVWGRFFEVTPEGEIVWEYISPYFSEDHPSYKGGNYVFRAYRYGADSPEIAGRLGL